MPIKQTGDFRFWVKQTLPEIYSDAMSYYELLEKVIEYLNQAIGQVNENSDLVEMVRDEFVKFRLEIINTTLPAHLEIILDEWFLSGKLAEIINHQVFDMKANKTSIELDDYEGADSTGLTPSTSAFILAMTDAITQKKKLKLGAGTYIIDVGIVQDMKGVELIIEGEAQGEVQIQSRILWRGGAGTMFTLNNGRNVRFKNVEVSGYLPGVDTNVYTPLSIGIKAQAAVIMDNCSFTGFENLMGWNGGYYHKFITCFISFTKIGFKNFNANNLTFTNCKVDQVEQLVTVNAGIGPVVFTGGSIERFTGYVFSAISGATPLLTLSNTYVENYPTLTPPTGMVGDYTAGGMATGFENINILGNSLQLSGIRRFIFGNALLKTVISLGNTIHYKASASSSEYYVFDGGNSLETVICNDVARDIGGFVGTYTPVYFYSPSGGVNLKEGSSRVYDAFTKKNVSLLPAWIPLTPLNGWVQSVTAGENTLAYRIIGNTIHLKGVINGGGATDPTMFNLTPLTTKTICYSKGLTI